MATSAAPEKMQFQSEAKQLLHLVIHSLYSHKEIFLRELVSNASDALDKLRFLSLTDASLTSDANEPGIRISLDKAAKIIKISDNGIGMTRDEVIENIGTIARSGSRAFLEKLSGNQKADSNLIGQFGVGFYSVFMVAAKVKLVTKRAGSAEPAVVWESEGELDFTIDTADRTEHGTEITIYLKEGEDTYADSWQIRSLIKKYSDYIAFPIYSPNDKGVDEVVNESKPIWVRPASELTPEMYEMFYKHSLGAFDKPLCTLHSKAEGVLEYNYLIFIPEKGGFEQFTYERKHGVKLYVKRVFIMDNCKELAPEYLRFIKGVVDSQDLPLNVSREMLQHNPVIEKMKKTLVNRVLNRLKEVADREPETYRTFWQQFGPVLKEGLHSDHENKDRLLEIIRFQSSMGTKDELVSLKQYVARMREGQKDIYYLTGENRDIVEKSPHLEVFKSKSIEVLYLTDPIDEFIVGDIFNFEGKTLKSIAKGDLDLGDLGKEEQEEKKKVESTYKKLVERIKNILAEQVKNVRVTARLKDSACCLVTDEHDMGAHMEKMFKAMGQEVPASKRILEINPEHAVVKNMNAVYEKNATDPTMEEWVKLLYDQALIAEGQLPADALAYTRRVTDLLVTVSGQK